MKWNVPFSAPTPAASSSPLLPHHPPTTILFTKIAWREHWLIRCGPRAHCAWQCSAILVWDWETVVVWVSLSKVDCDTVEPEVWHSLGGWVKRGPYDHSYQFLIFLKWVNYGDRTSNSVTGSCRHMDRSSDSRGSTYWNKQQCHPKARTVASGHMSCTLTL